MRIEKLMEKAKWMRYCNLSDNVYKTYEKLLQSVNEIIKDLYKKWISRVGENPQDRLDSFLMRKKTKEKYSKLECNIDPVILDLCQEAYHWLDLDFKLTINIQLVYDKWDTLSLVYENVLSVVSSYNKILDGD